MKKSRIETMIRWLWKTTYVDVYTRNEIDGKIYKPPFRLIAAQGTVFSDRRRKALPILKDNSITKSVRLVFLPRNGGHLPLLVTLKDKIFLRCEHGIWVVPRGDIRPIYRFVKHHRENTCPQTTP